MPLFPRDGLPKPHETALVTQSVFQQGQSSTDTKIEALMKQMAEMHLWMNMLIKKVSKHIKTGFVKF